MAKLTRYVFAQLLIGTLLVTVSLSAVVWLGQSLRFVELIVNRGLSAGTFVYLVALLLPNFLIIIIPFALFATILFVYNRMVHDRELVVMRAAGLSQGNLIKPALLISMLVVALLYSLHLYIAPISKTAFKDLRWTIRYGYSQIVLQEGTFNTFSKDITVYIRERTSEGEILGILARDSRESNKPFTLMAERGALVKAENGTRIVMHNGNRQELHPETGNLSILYFDRYVFDLGLGGTAGKTRDREASEMSLSELLTIETVPGVSKNNHGPYRVSGHSRIATPLYALTYAFIALAALISGGFTRRTMTRRIVLSVLLVILVQLSALGIENLAAKNIALIPLLYANIAIPASIALYLIFRYPRRPAKHGKESIAAITP